MDLIYITAPSYSGSTLLTLLLAAHPRIATVGELKASVMGDLKVYDCSCGARIGCCRFWAQLGDELENRGVPLNLSALGTHFRSADRSLLDLVLRARLRGPWFEALRTVALRTIPGAKRGWDAILERNRKLIDAVSSLQHAAVFLDSSKDPIRLKYLIASGNWRMRVIHLVRDGRATAASHMNHHGTSMEVATREWRRTHEECERVRTLLPRESWHDVRYEQLCHNPREVLAALCRFIDLPQFLPSDHLGAVEHHILGNRMRLTVPLKIVLDEAWRTTLTPEELAIFERRAGDLNRRYGYDT